MKTFPLSRLPYQATAIITEISGTEHIRQYLHSMGFLPGVPIVCIGTSPHGDPKAYLVRGCVIALRMADSQNILVQEVEALGKSKKNCCTGR